MIEIAALGFFASLSLEPYFQLVRGQLDLFRRCCVFISARASTFRGKGVVGIDNFGHCLTFILRVFIDVDVRFFRDM